MFLFRGRSRVCFSGQVPRIRRRNSGLFGWVRNLADGRVEAVFEGEKEAIEKMVEWCRAGPENAKVTGSRSCCGRLPKETSKGFCCVGNYKP